MNHRETTSVPLGAVSALLCMALLLPVTGFARGCPLAGVQSAAMLVQEHPYLASVGAPALRFAEAPQPPEMLQRPSLSPAPVAAATSDVTLPESLSSVQQPTDSVATSSNPSTASTKSTANVAVGEQPAASHTPPPIIPDEVRPRVRPEDFLPFFQIPVSQPGDVNVVVPAARSAPAPATIPISSATYTQTPR
jgi:hypothetical protein